MCAAVLLAALIVGVLVVRALGRVQRELEAERSAHDSSRAQVLSLTERNDAAAAASAQANAAADAREADLRSRLTALSTEQTERQEKLTALEAANAALEAELRRVPELTAELAALRQRLDEAHQQQSQLRAEFAALETSAREQSRAAAEKIALLEQAEARLTKEFENVANRIFADKQRQFTESSKESVGALLSPVRQQLNDFRKKVEDIYDNENRERASLRSEITQLKSLNERISGDALNLTNALKGDSKVRGNWGEVQLERLLEQSGLVKGREYEVQMSLKSADGQRFQPDVVIHLPDQKDLVVDSKVSLNAYEEYHAADDDDERARQIARHVAALRTHINDLSKKSYDELVGISSPDLVIMFVPIEPALLLALEHQPDLYIEAHQKNIMLVSPSLLMGTLRIIHTIWRHEYQNKNTLKIADEAGKMYDGFVNFVDALERVGTQLDKARAEYDLAHNRLTGGRGNLVRRTEKLRQLGVKAKKSLSPKLLDAAEVEPSEEDAEERPLLTADPD